jgi:hypothetical protein
MNATVTILSLVSVVTLLSGSPQSTGSGRANLPSMTLVATGLTQQYNLRQSGIYSFAGADPTQGGPKARAR